MSESDENNVLTRKLRGQEKAKMPAGSVVAKALSAAFARVGEDIGGMVSIVASCQDSVVVQEDLVSVAEDESLICVLARESAALGMVRADANVVASVLEYLTTERITANEPEARRPTKTDAAIVGDFLDRFLRCFDKELAYLDKPPNFADFRCARALSDGRAIRMALEEMSYQHYEIGVDLGENGRSGTISLYFPLEAPRDARAGGDEAGWAATWRRNALTFPAEVDAVLHRVLMPLEDIMSLEPGKTITIPQSQFAAVSIEGGNRKVAVYGKLGRSGAMRAIKLNAKSVEAVSGETIDGRADGMPPGGTGDIDVGQAPMDAPMALERDIDVKPTGLGDLPDIADMPFGANVDAAMAPDVPDMSDLSDLPELGGSPPPE